ncbi:37 kDa salivary gland allergen Aed a 2-like [Anopheles maculipalpis]|uniref:37 kDa salivary gland allergen Aed a 2-like n=1 Tax=Anopheles maculipalpis TaxID=1496333 RepID=UPI002159920A|nr:37 kDa salivary gland allergen Aed a 2-like [Anopheles maculipalpis]
MLKDTIFISLSALCFVSVVQGGTVKECEDRMAASLKPKLCEVRQYKLFESQDMYNHIDCCMKALDFVESNGSGNYHKLYRLLNDIKQSRTHGEDLETCVGKSKRAEANKRAYEYYKCLLDSKSGQTFKKAFDLKELIKAGKMKEGSRYGPEVDKKIQEIDDEICKN